MLDSISTKIFADGADLDQILRLAQDTRVEGFTTNPSLMWKAGLTDYSEFARSLLEQITDKPISFEVFADDVGDIGRQARVIATWGSNVYVKVPVTTIDGRVPGAARARAVGGGSQGQRDRVVDARPGRRDRRTRCATVRRATSRCSRAASRTRAWSRCRS